MKNKLLHYKLNIFITMLFMVIATILLGACQKDKEKPKDMTQGRPVLNILFIGNEYTISNYMPYMLKTFAESDPTSHFKVEVEVHAANNTSLSQLWNMPGTRDILTSKKWDYVVIQPTSMWASSDGSVHITRKAISVWSSQIKSLGSQPVLFETWPLEMTHPNYASPKYIKLKNYKNMFKRIKGYSKALSEKYKLLLAPVGSYWMSAIHKKTGIKLYGVDRSSPTINGSFLTALVLYKTLVDNTLDDIGYIPEGMTQEDKNKLIKIVSKKYDK